MNLKYALENAKKFNPDSRIILIGDNVTHYPDFVEYHYMNNFDKYSKEFEKIYVHLSKSNPEIEMFCIKRWLILLNFLEKMNFEKAFTIDSDILLFQDISKDLKNYIKYDVVIVNGTNRCLNFINNINVLRYYKKIVFDFYKNKNFRKENKVTDMCFWKRLNDSKKFSVGEATKSINKSFYDMGFLSENYYKGYNSKKIKKLVFLEGLPFVEINKDLFKLKSIHFQGPTKFYMKYFNNGKYNFLIKLKVKTLMWARDNFSGKISNNMRDKIKKLMIKLGV